MAQFQVGEFLFDTSSGRLSRGDQVDMALAPQPAQLLELLIEHHPAAVSREEIRRRIWPDVNVEFEQSLHHCVRQVRQALGDSASDPTYVRTIHRKGYQLIAPVAVASPGAISFANTSTNTSDSSQAELQTSARDSSESLAWKARMEFLLRSTFYWTAAAAVVVAIGVLVGRSTTWFDEPIRVAVMSFESPGAPNSIAEELVSTLTNHPDYLLEVIGPTTTQRYEGQPEGLSRLIQAYRIDVVLNGRYSEGNPPGRLLAEVIRASDGAHVWVRTFDAGDPSSAKGISEGLYQYIEDYPPEEDD